MAEYDLDEYEDYEDEGGEYEEEGEGYEEEEEEEEDRLPTQEELEYLELRQKLKDSIRKKMKKDPSSDLAGSREKKNKMPYDNFGSFFGPSQPVIAQRVIQESKSLLENPHLAERFSKPKTVENRNGSSTPAVSKPRPNGQQPRRVDNSAKPKAKIQMLKNTRDYSFLLSDDAELPIPPKNPPKSGPTTRPEMHLSQRQPNNSGRTLSNGHREERKSLPTSNQMRPKAGQQSQRLSAVSNGQQSQRPSAVSNGQQSQRPSTVGKLTSTSVDSRKQVGRNEGSGPGRPGPPPGQKPLPSKMPAVVNKSKVIPPPVSRGSIPTGHKPQVSRPLPPIQKKPLEQKRDDRGSTKGNIIRKPVVSSKPQMKQQPSRLPARPPASSHQREKLQKRPARPFDDEDDDKNAISMIRNMFGYNPNRYRGVNDDDDSDMEAGFDDIMMEEKRSARIAAKEDEEELRKIEEEERRERMRKAAKKRKLNQR
ncbi:putative chromatin SPT2 [Helianthus annuus]|uniref:Chromatin SPT2 n=1 Tax=Helianthus annuus TaxID=4232 RepID=A0A251RSH7_HELAN|nr:protein SPT2 homolog [Helianthus annuus]KAF5795350.1 putative chromatin SPT2 [Helianthus annuus]KAJ0538863.1 putative chromatin SPT2 [Helianthus annuus]KAJ0553493.1 putative chromatin SPT2 [Helianthus annuus]KAJ0722407.1 putative chromatin SPT2 [Helianthus annuus]KAJ0897819.1 putative chromatin SPT2 [Helianthus annuus]